MTEHILNWVNICVKQDEKILLLNRQHDHFKGWIPPGGKEETGLTALDLELKGISGFTNPGKQERYVYYDFLCQSFEGELLRDSPEGQPKWWPIAELANLDMQETIRQRLPLYLRKGSFERIHYWDEEKGCVAETKTILHGED